MLVKDTVAFNFGHHTGLCEGIDEQRGEDGDAEGSEWRKVLKKQEGGHETK